MKKTTALIFVLLVLCGCGATKSLTVEDRSKIHTLAIAPSDVTYEAKKDTIQLMNKSRTNAMMWGGLVGTLIYESVRDNTPEDVILQLLEKEGMLKNTIAEAMTYQFQESGLFEKVTSDKQASDAHMLIKMPIFQLLISNDDQYKLVFRLDGQLKDNKGNVLWEGWEFLTAFNEQAPTHPFEVYVKDPVIFKQSISIVAQMIARLYIEGMGGKPAPLNKELHGKI